MAGALTANPVDARYQESNPGDPAIAIADVSMLSPVDGANNALLTGIVIVTEIDEAATFTLQWVKTTPGAGVADDPIGDAVGDPFTVTTGDSELDTGPIVVQAIDRGPGLTSAYALTIAAEPSSDVTVTAVYADAVLYD